jgi:hypothetical protein
MLMRGDLNKIIEEMNKVMEGAFNRIQALEDRIMVLEDPVEAPVATLVPKRGPGRPPGAKNKKNAA